MGNTLGAPLIPRRRRPAPLLQGDDPRTAASTTCTPAKQVLATDERPQYVVLADSLPKNPSGEVLKRGLRDQHAGSRPTNRWAPEPCGEPGAGLTEGGHAGPMDLQDPVEALRRLGGVADGTTLRLLGDPWLLRRAVS